MESNNIGGGHVLRIAAEIIMLALLLFDRASVVAFTMNAGGGAAYSKIQDTIDNASVGDIILVESGIYYENVNVNKQLTLRGVSTGGGSQ